MALPASKMVSTKTVVPQAPSTVALPSGTVHPTVIAKLKRHAVQSAAQIAASKARIALIQQAFAQLPAADVNAVVVAGYPPPTT